MSGGRRPHALIHPGKGYENMSIHENAEVLLASIVGKLLDAFRRAATGQGCAKKAGMAVAGIRWSGAKRRPISTTQVQP